MIYANNRIEEFSTLPSAKLTVDEFREIWFQNAADPPSFNQPRPNTAQIEDGGRDVEEAEETQLLSTQVEGNNPKPEIDGEVDEAEAQAAFLEEMVADKALEDEINRHLGQEEFQQALAEMDGTTTSISRLMLAIRQEQANALIDEGNLSDLDDDDEVSGAIIDEGSEHFILRAQLWMESNRDYLIEQRGMTPHNLS